MVPNFSEPPNSLKGVKVTVIENQIRFLTKKKDPKYYFFAKSILEHCEKHEVDPSIVVALIMTESSFKVGAKNKHTGDLGLGQINPRVWSVELKRLFGENLDTKRLIKDYDYAIGLTVKILAYHQKTNDPHWVGRYHSKTPSLKVAYAEKVEKKIKRVPSMIALNFDVVF